mmetsp:Transcript_55912/g.155916  ORF Transcript_55912/g.155916 Transcript_55912/m.155916 type:complete len:256 (-) Transcript_55912:30-797(-)
MPNGAKSSSSSARRSVAIRHVASTSRASSHWSMMSPTRAAIATMVSCRKFTVGLSCRPRTGPRWLLWRRHSSRDARDGRGDRRKRSRRKNKSAAKRPLEGLQGRAGWPRWHRIRRRCRRCLELADRTTAVAKLESGSPRSGASSLTTPPSAAAATLVVDRPLRRDLVESWRQRPRLQPRRPRHCSRSQRHRRSSPTRQSRARRDRGVPSSGAGFDFAVRRHRFRFRKVRARTEIGGVPTAQSRRVWRGAVCIFSG